MKDSYALKDSYARHDPRVVTTRAELKADLTMSGLAMVRATQNFIQEAADSAVSATMEEVTCLENTKWETQSNEDKTTTQRRFVSSESGTGWHERGGDWTRWQLSQSDFVFGCGTVSQCPLCVFPPCRSCNP